MRYNKLVLISFGKKGISARFLIGSKFCKKRVKIKERGRPHCRLAQKSKL